MANDSILKFRLGLFVLGALLLLAMLIVMFGEFPDFFRSQVRYTLKLPQAPGIVEGTPVRKSGIRIGEVASVDLDPDTGEVTLGIYVEKRYQLRTTDQMTITRGLVMGESTINFAPKPEAKGEAAPDGFVFKGAIPDDIAKALTEARDLVPSGREAIEEVRQAAKKINEMMPEIRKTNAELQVTLNNMGRAAESVDNLLRTNQDRIGTAIENVSKVAAEMANLFTPDNQKKLTRLIDNAATVSDRLPGFFSEANRQNLENSLKNVGQATENLSALLSEENRKAANQAIKNIADASERLAKVFSDQNQKNITDILANAKKSSDQLDSLMQNLNAASADARQVMSRAGKSIDQFDEAMTSIRDVAKLVGERGPVILKNIEDASGRLSQISLEVGEFTRLLASGDGTLRRLLQDPSLYNNINATACSVNTAVSRLDRILKDVGVFADKIARHPELLGVRGTVAPSSGIK